jgi:hypothetical protein
MAGGSGEEQAVERVQNPVDGTYPALANRGGVDSLGLKRRRGRKLHESSQRFRLPRRPVSWRARWVNPEEG